MSMHSGRTIVAVVGEDGRYAPVRRRAIERAREDGATLLLYDVDATTSPFESPLPTEWSGEGTQEQFGHRLGPDDLEAAGRAPVAAAVREARASGVDAFGWLPDQADSEALARYAADEGASLVVVPAGDDLADELGGTLDGIEVEAVPATTAR